MFKLEGIVPPLATPFDTDGNVDTDSLRRLVEHLLAGGVHGLFVLGSTGEGASLDQDERATIVRTVVEANRERVPVLVGVMGTSMRRLLDYIDMAHQIGADAVVATSMYYYTSNQTEIAHLFRLLKQKSTLPLVAYNIPSMVKVALDGNTVVQLAREGTICALKDSSADLSAGREILLQVRNVPNFSVLTGLEFVVDLALLAGFHGAVPGLGNVAPKPYVDIYNLIKAGELQAARALQEKLISLFRITRQGGASQSHSAGALSGFKAALKRQGIFASSGMHEPMQSLSAEEEEQVYAVMQESGLF